MSLQIHCEYGLKSDIGQPTQDNECHQGDNLLSSRGNWTYLVGNKIYYLTSDKLYNSESIVCETFLLT